MYPLKNGDEFEDELAVVLVVPANEWERCGAECDGTVALSDNADEDEAKVVVLLGQRGITGSCMGIAAPGAIELLLVPFFPVVVVVDVTVEEASKLAETGRGNK